MKVWMLETDRGHFEPRALHGLYVNRDAVIGAIKEMLGDCTIHDCRDGAIRASKTAGYWNLYASMHEVNGMRVWGASDYRYEVKWREEDGAFVATVKEFKLLSAHADTMVKAMDEIVEVVGCVLDDLAMHGDPAPVPHYLVSGEVSS